MPLNDMSSEDLATLSRALSDLAHAGGVLAAVQLTPIFDLTPGRAITIRLDYTMPQVSVAGDRDRDRSIFMADDTALDVAIEPGKLYPAPPLHTLPDYLKFRPSAEVEPSDPVLAPVETAPAATEAEGPLAEGEPASGIPHSSAVPSSAVGVSGPLSLGAHVDQDTVQGSAAPVVGAAKDSGGGQQPAAASPPVAPHSAPVSGSACALAARALQNRSSSAWTAEEDERLIALIVAGVTQQGLTKKAAMEAAASQLDRPVPGTVYRATHALQERVRLALSAAQAPRSPNADVTAPAEGETAVKGDTLASVQNAPAPYLDARPRKAAIAHGNLIPKDQITDRPGIKPSDPVWAHVTSLPRRDGWTLQRDIDLLELAILGWLQNEISLELVIEAKLIRPRLDLLTGLYTDEAGKQVRSFKRENVLYALKALQANKAA